jgi:integrase
MSNNETRLATNIWQRGNRVVIRLRLNNVSITRTIGDIDEPDILTKAAKEIASLRNNKSHNNSYTISLTLNQIIIEYWNNRKHIQGLSLNTLKNELCRLRWLQNYWSSYRLIDITPVKIEQSLLDLYDVKKIGHASANLYLSTLSSIFEFCQSRGYVANNPVSSVKRYKINNNRRRYLSRGEYKLLLLACSKAVRASDKHKRLYRQLMRMIILTVHTGLRKGEIINVKVQDIDFEARYLTLTHTKSNKVRNIPLAPAALQAIGRELYPRTPESRGYLFMRHGRPLGDIQQRWTRVRRLAGLEDLHWHDLRHTYCSWATMAGVDSATIQAVLGHSTPSLTDRYTHLSSSHIMSSAATLSKWLSNNSP